MPRIFSRRSSVIFFFLFEMLAAVRIVSIRQHRSVIGPHAAYVSLRQHTPAYLAAARIFWSSTVSSMCTRVAVLYTCVYQHIPTLTIHPPTHQPIHILNILSYHSIRPHMSAYVSIRQHTSV
jgi:hypothetical protein